MKEEFWTNLMKTFWTVSEKGSGVLMLFRLLMVIWVPQMEQLRA